MSSANVSILPFSGVQTTCYSGNTPPPRPHDISTTTTMNWNISEKRQESNLRSSPSRSFRAQNPRSSPSPSREQLANDSNLSALGPTEKENHQHGRQPLTTEESEAVRIERLGRQRPEVFDSLSAEVGFVFSIAMSQVLTVGSLLFPMKCITILTNIGILCIRLHSGTSNSH
jgi:hypothetical protein